MPPTDGDVMAPSTMPESLKIGSAGDSNASLAANSSLSAPYTCNFCQRTFPRLSLLKKHEQAHSDEMPFRCEFCLRLFKHKRSRDRHVKLHTGDKKYRCQHCEAAFSRSDHLKIHIKTHDTRKPFQCNVCQRGYSTAAALTSHMLNHRRESGSRCGSLCSSTSSPVSVASSLASMPSSRSSNASTPCPSITPSLPSPVSPSPLTPLPCTTSAAGATTGVPLPRQPPTAPKPAPVRHHPPPPTPEPSPKPAHDSCCLDYSSGVESPVEPKGDADADERVKLSNTVSNEQQQHQKLHQQHSAPHQRHDSDSNINSIVLTCPYCAKESFSSLEALSLHIQALHGPLPYADGVKLAAREVSDVVPVYACQLCGLRVTSLPALQQHTLSVHSLADVLKLYCQSPPLAAGVGDHQRVNTEPPQSTATDLSCRRKRTASPTTPPPERTDLTPAAPPEPRYFCPHCPTDFALADVDQLNHHVSMHLVSTSTEYGCQSCHKTFLQPDELQKHLLDMHAHHLYRCALCQETFDTKVSIQVHLAVKHSNECKLFRCTACASVYRNEADFATHVKAVHTSCLAPKAVTYADLRCPETFGTAFLLDRHPQLSHSTGVVGHEPPPPPLTSSVVEEAPAVLNLSLHCAYCGQTCKSRLELEAHTKALHQPPPVSCSAPAPASTGGLKCNICDDVFATAAALTEHKLSHCKALGASQCSVCRAGVETEEQFYAHLHQHGQRTPPLSCIVCRQTLSTAVDVEMHAKFHAKSEPLYPCCFCRQNFESQNLIANGMAPGGLQTYVCKQCLHVKHQQLILQSLSLAPPPSLPPPPLPPPPTGLPPRSYQCIKCQLVFATEAEIQAHVATHLRTEGSEHPCHLCPLGAEFDTPLKLQTHLIEHTFAGCPAFTCYLCGAAFTAAANLQRHMFEHGLATRPYDCSRCQLKFFFRAELENHLHCHHREGVDVATAEAPVIVAAPGETTQDASTDVDGDAKIDVDDDAKIDVDDDAKIDVDGDAKVDVDGDEMEESDEVDDDEEELEGEEETSSASSSESTEISLSEAKKAANAVPDEISDVVDRSVKERPVAANGGSGDGKYRCDRCDQSFPCLSNLQGHIRIHTQSTRFTCPTCHKEFALSRNLHIHMRSHSGEKPYECPVCHKRFARKENRKAHLKLHSGVKPFTCDICSKSFSRKCHLREHQRTHADPAITQSRKTKGDQAQPHQPIQKGSA